MLGADGLESKERETLSGKLYATSEQLDELMNCCIFRECEN